MVAALTPTLPQANEAFQSREKCAEAAFILFNYSFNTRNLLSWIKDVTLIEVILPSVASLTVAKCEPKK